MRRRAYLLWLGTATPVAITGCTGDGGQQSPIPETGEDTSDAIETGNGVFEITARQIGASISVPEGAETPTPGETMEYSVAITNTGEMSGSQTIRFLVDGEVIQETELTLKPSEPGSVTFDIDRTTIRNGDDYTIRTENDSVSGELNG
jgi:hypothetical protein